MTVSLLNVTRQELLDFVGLNETVVSASGTRIVTESGQELIDFVGQFGAVPFGYGPRDIIDAATAFLASGRPTFVQPLLNPEVEQLAKRLIEIAPGNMSRVTFTTSGAETVEAAIKLARAATNRELILGTCTGFHGKTQGAVGVTGKQVYREPFHLRPDGFSHVPYGDLAALETMLQKHRVAAFFVEAVQGEAGMVTPPEGYLFAAQTLCRKYGTLFVLDEIQTGLGRTGQLFAATAHGLTPDVLLLAKALGGGIVPIGACIYGEKCWSRDFDRHHSSTFAVNGFTAAVGLAVLEQLTANDGEMIERAAERGAYLRAGLQRLVARYPQVFESLDGRGLMLGLKFRRWPGDRLYTLSLASAFGALVPIVCGYLKSRHGVYCLPTLSEGNVLRIQPPLTISLDEIDVLLEGLNAAAELIAHDQQHRLILEAHGFAGPRGPLAKWLAPVAAKRRNGGECLGRFAFLLHPTTPESVNGDSIVDALGLSMQEKAFMQDWLAEFSEWAKPDLDTGVSYHARHIYNDDGNYVEGWLVGSLLQPRDLMRLSMSKRRKLLDNYLQTVSTLDVDFVGLGAYTSVISSAGSDVVNERFHTTTGNSLTAMVGVDALVTTCAARGAPLAKRLTGVIGAYGSVGRLASLRLGKFSEHLVLLGNSANLGAMHELRLVGGELYGAALQAIQSGHPTGIAKTLAALLPDSATIERLLARDLDDGDQLRELFDSIDALAREQADYLPAVTIASDLDHWLPRLEVVLSATSNGSAFIDPAALHHNAIICDCAQPPDIGHASLPQRPDVTVIEGGLIHMPERSYRFGDQHLTSLPSGTIFSCLAETIVLTMAGEQRDYSIGKRPPLADAEAIFELARNFGFASAVEQPIEKAG
jgi:acetylornithine/succinyldiaminopimelate/putrescine aminotransferase/predicted amino acid dehydrogenase